MPPSGRSTTTPASSPPPISSCRWWTIPFDFGRIAATNAISDVYAMGGKPIMALAILGMPVDKMPPEMVRRILTAGRGLPRRGDPRCRRPFHRHARADLRPRRDRHVPVQDVRRNSGARPGDALILTKGPGVGIYSAGLQEGRALARGLCRAHRHHDAAQPHRRGAGRTMPSTPSPTSPASALLGHALEMARGSGARLVLQLDSLPLLAQAAALAQAGFVTGASTRNWASYHDSVDLPEA